MDMDDKTKKELARKAAKAAYDKKRRESQTDDQKKKRLETRAAYEKTRRDSETDEQKKKRLEARAVYEKKSRKNESDEKRSKRLKINEEYMKTRGENETSEQRANRLKAHAAYEKESRANETEAQRSNRLEGSMANFRTKVGNETEEQQIQRLEANAAQQRQKRSNETEAKANERRQNIAKSKRQRLSHETNDDRQHRLEEKQLRLQRQKITKCEELKRTAENAYANENTIEEYYCGKMNHTCIECNAKHFEDEAFQYKTMQNVDGDSVKCKTYTKCCKNGQVKFEKRDKNGGGMKEYPEVLKNLMKKEDEIGKNFMDNIRSINSSFGFASMGANIAPPPGYGPYCFRIHGQIYHRTGTLHPAEGESRQYAQLYILDTNEANQERMNHSANKNVDPIVFNIVADFMEKNNELCKSYRMLHEVEKESIREAEENGTPYNEVTMAILNDRTADKRRYNVATANEVAVVFQNKDGEPPLERDLIIHTKPSPGDPNKGMKRIDIFHKNLDAMIYPLFFPYGEQGWGLDMKKTTLKGDKRMTLMDYYSYLLSVRNDFNPILNGGKLTQQFFVDQYVKIEANRLSYLTMHQNDLRGDTLKGLQDYVASEAEAQGKQPGTVVILPSSFQGSPRNMQQNYQDAMSIVTKYGKPDLFVTVTCNPKWKEIQENLEPWQSAEHRPDLVARVFNLKFKKLLSEVVNEKGGIFGKVIAYVHVIEFQKRGLPHAHMLLILDKNSKLNTSQKIDNVVKAEIPNKIKNPRLFEIVTSHMVHGPCGKGIRCPCMINEKCSKNFPKEFQTETLGNADVSDGFAKYKRSRGVELIVKGRTVDNRWIVPYNPYLLLKYNCHINVEVCSSVKCVKYIYKYLYKGHDCANVEVKEMNTVSHDEVKKHVDSRYVSAPEAAWRLLGHSMHDQSHSVERLAVHLPGEEFIVLKTKSGGNDANEVFQEGENIVEQQVEKAEKKHTTLSGWFELNKQDPEARNYYYWETPLHFTWLKQERKWKIRERCFNKIGRMYTVSPKDPERFYLRLLLLHVKGVTSFEDLRTVDGTIFDTFRETAQARGLLEDDRVWQNTMNDAIACQMPHQLRQIFAYICAYCSPSDPKKLWNDNLTDMMEDICLKIHERQGDCRNCELYALKDLKEVLTLLGIKLTDLGLTEPPTNLPDITEDLFNVDFEMSEGEKMIETLNYEQRRALDAVLNAMNDTTLRSKCFFLDGPGGSGKTYLYSTLLHMIRGRSLTVLPAASTGIAANLLSGGRTFHSMFKLGIPITDRTVSRISPSSLAADILRNAILIIIDECTMASCHAMDAIDRCLRDVMECCGGKEIPFGGKVILLGGDFRQCLAIVPHAQRPAIVQASLKYCCMWNEFQKLTLKNNVRSEDPLYSEWLLKLGDGSLANDCGLEEGIIEIPENMICHGSLVEEIYGNTITIENVKSMSKRAILCPKNDSVDKINDDIMKLIEGEEHIYFSSDKTDVDANNATDFTDEFVNSLTPSGMPPHVLKLKIGAVIMLLRNLNTKKGLCNGTRLYVTGLQRNLIKAEVLTGSSEGNEVLIPRIDLSPSDTGLPFKLTRRQFPVKVAFAMTINKSQGQTLDKVGIFLPDPVFGHGQLYVAFSRVRRSEDVKVKVLDTPDQGRLIKDSEKIPIRTMKVKQQVMHNWSS